MPKPTTPATPAPLAQYAEKGPTPLHESFAAWLTEQTGIEVDVKSVQLATALRGNFQKSETNQADLERRRQEALNKQQQRAERVSQPKADKTPVEKTPAAPKPSAPKASTKKAAATEEATPTAPRRRGRRAAAAS